MSHLDPFAAGIQNFQRYGTYNYKFDNVGNMIFNSSSVDFSQVYLAFPLQNAVYDTNKIQTFYDPSFTETQITSSATVDVTTIQNQLSAIQAENTALKAQLDAIINADIVSDQDANAQITKRLIIELRKALGEGITDSDFSDVFPYMPLKSSTTIT